MATNDDAYHQVLEELGKLHQAWQIYREVVNRAIGLLNHEVIEFRDRLDKDDRAREARQKDVDAKLETISQGQARIQRWQWIRVGIEAAAILIVIALLIGKTWL